jgi:hypothetical protein
MRGAVIDILDVEKRFLRGCKTCRALPDREKRFHKVETGWPDVVRDTTEAYSYSDVAMPRFRPSPFDVSDMLTALAWARGLQPNEFRLAWSR